MYQPDNEQSEAVKRETICYIRENSKSAAASPKHYGSVIGSYDKLPG